jgi:DNA-binding transcriptional regulator YiaG
MPKSTAAPAPKIDQKLLKIGRFIEALREKNNITQGELAERIGSSQSVGSRISPLKCWIK